VRVAGEHVGFADRCGRDRQRAPPPARPPARCLSLAWASLSLYLAGWSNPHTAHIEENAGRVHGFRLVYLCDDREEIYVHLRCVTIRDAAVPCSVPVRPDSGLHID
jgi:hypothetical protein